MCRQSHVRSVWCRAHRCDLWCVGLNVLRTVASCHHRYSSVLRVLGLESLWGLFDPCRVPCPRFVCLLLTAIHWRSERSDTGKKDVYTWGCCSLGQCGLPRHLFAAEIAARKATEAALPSLPSLPSTASGCECVCYHCLLFPSPCVLCGCLSPSVVRHHSFMCIAYCACSELEFVVFSPVHSSGQRVGGPWA